MLSYPGRGRALSIASPSLQQLRTGRSGRNPLVQTREKPRDAIAQDVRQHKRAETKPATGEYASGPLEHFFPQESKEGGSVRVERESRGVVRFTSSRERDVDQVRPSRKLPPRPLRRILFRVMLAGLECMDRSAHRQDRIRLRSPVLNFGGPGGRVTSVRSNGPDELGV